MAEPDGIAQERAKQRQLQDAARQRETERAETARRQNMLREIKQDTAAVLRLLEDQGYPGMKEITMREPGRFFKGRESVKAVWPIGGWTAGTDRDGNSVHKTIYLLSDGRLMSSLDSSYFNYYSDIRPERENIAIVTAAYEGLRRLRSTLESAAGGI